MSINKNLATLLSLVTSKAAIASFKYIGVPHFFSVFFACLYQRYLSENIEHPSEVFFGTDEQEIRKKNKTKYKVLFFFNILSPIPRIFKCSLPNT